MPKMKMMKHIITQMETGGGKIKQKRKINSRKKGKNARRKRRNEYGKENQLQAKRR